MLVDPLKRKRVEETTGTTRLDGEARRLQGPEKGNIKDIEEFKNEEEKAIILSWREDPGIMWLSENSEYTI